MIHTTYQVTGRDDEILDLDLSASSNKIKRYGAIATRFAKLANTFLAGVPLVCVVLWLN